MKFTCYIESDFDYPYIARIWGIPLESLRTLDHEFDEWSKTTDISLYRAGKELCFKTDADRLAFIMSWA